MIRKAFWFVLIFTAISLLGFMAGMALNIIPRASAAELDPALVIILDRSNPGLKSLAMFMPWDVIQVWFQQTGAESYIVVLETETGGVRSRQSVVVPANSQPQAGCGFAFPGGVVGVEIKRIVILELPSLVVRDERWVK
jgi:hypothetical protein